MEGCGGEKNAELGQPGLLGALDASVARVFQLKTHHGDICGHEHQDDEGQVPSNDDRDVVEDGLFPNRRVLVEDDDHSH